MKMGIPYTEWGVGHQIERMNIFTCPVLGIKIGNQVKWMMILSTDLNKACGNTIDAHEAAQMHQNFSQQLLQDHIAACSLPEHNLISVSTSAISHLMNTLPGILKKLLLCSSGRTASHLCSFSLRMDLLPVWPACSEIKVLSLKETGDTGQQLQGKWH